MHRALLFLFIAYALASVYIQTADLPIKQITTPVMGGFVAVCAVIGFFARRLKGREALILASAWALAACGDVFFEKSRLSTTAAEAGQNFMIAVGFFLIAYLIFGISFCVIGLRARLRPWIYIVTLLISGTMGVIAFRSLLVPAGQTALVVFYSVQAVILLFGGLLSVLTKRYWFACIGILLFFSDWLVGLRAFGNPAVMPPLVTDHILILILITYYLPMLASIDYSLMPRGVEAGA
ncbi:MAG TPA: lysoplasmalogenase family protein [Anaerolineales bacterium]|nr:lysoplasmalogenase family protein [Anaerolineales bacterium]